jgi:hypothetical protein
MNDTESCGDVELKMKSQNKWYSPEAMHLFLPTFPTSSLNEDIFNQEVFIKQQLRKALKRLV